MSIIPTFKTKRLILREVTEADAPSWQKHFAHYEIIRTLSDVVPWPYPENGVLDFLKNQIFPHQGKNRWHWGIFLKVNPTELIGTVELRQTPNDGGHRGFWLARKYWNQGFMTEAVVPVMDYAFDKLGFNVLLFSNAVGNVASRRIKEKTGARLVRIEPGKFVDPQFKEKEIWEIKKEEWLQYRKNFR